jgi:hypothetical protein
MLQTGLSAHWRHDECYDDVTPIDWSQSFRTHRPDAVHSMQNYFANTCPTTLIKMPTERLNAQ